MPFMPLFRFEIPDSRCSRSFARRRASHGPPDGFQDPFEFLEHGIVRKPQHVLSLMPQPRVASDIFRGVGKVLAAVELNDQALLVRRKIRDVLAQGNLAAKLAFGEPPAAQVIPEAAFGVGGAAAELAGEVALVDR